VDRWVWQARTAKQAAGRSGPTASMGNTLLETCFHEEPKRIAKGLDRQAQARRNARGVRFDRSF
jgi:hypothetical protein